MVHDSASTSDSASSGNPSIPPANGRCVVDGLPAEVLMYIFQLGMAISLSENEDFSDSDSSVSDDIDSDKLELPWELLVSKICRRWRETAIQTASLWTNIEFNLDPMTITKNKEYLKRSKNAPIDILIDFLDTDEDPVSVVALTRMAMTCVIPHVQHWRSFRLCSSIYTPIARALAMLGQCRSAPLLETLYLDFTHDQEPNEPFPIPRLAKQDFVIFHGVVPRLKRLSLSGVFLNWPKYHGLAELTTLHLSCHSYDVLPSYSDFVRILRESPHLTDLTIGESGPAGSAKDWDMSPVILPSLKKLEFGYLKMSVVYGLIQRFVMPKLTQLMFDHDGSRSGDALLNFMTTPHTITGHSILSKLETWEVAGINCCKGPLRKAYATATDLKELRLSMDMLRSSWLKYLLKVDPSTGDVFLPKLEKLSIVTPDESSVYKVVRGRLAKSKTKTWKTLILKTVGRQKLTSTREAWLRGALEKVEIERSFLMFGGTMEEDTDRLSDSSDSSAGREECDELAAEDTDSAFDSEYDSDLGWEGWDDGSDEIF